MKAQIRHKLTLLSAYALSLTALSANEYWDRYSQDYVPITQRDMSMTMTNFKAFVDYSDEMLVLQMADGEGEISVPVNDNITGNLKLELERMDEAYQFLNQRMFDKALDIMRPEIYPLIKFHQVPARFSDLHGPLIRLLEVLIRTENYEEAEFILGKIDLAKSIPDYSQIAVKLMETYLAGDNFNSATQLALKLPVEGEYRSNIDAITSLADQMRATGKFKEVIPLYRRILSLLPKEQQGSMPIWLAYCLVLADELDEVEGMLDNIPQPSNRLPEFSLYKLLEGSIQYKYSEFGIALDILTKGFVSADPSYTWIPEMLFLIGDCYRMNERPEAARNVWKEVSILYPSSPWAEKANNFMEKLPKAPEPTNTNEEDSEPGEA